MGKILLLKDYRQYYGKKLDYDWFAPEPGASNGYMDIYSDLYRLVPSLTTGSTGNGQAYTISLGDSGKLLVTNDVSKNNFEIDQAIPSTAENCYAAYCPKGHLGTYNLNIPLLFNNTTYTGISKPFPYIIRSTSSPIKLEYCLYGPTLSNDATWYYWNGTNWTGGNWTDTYYYYGGHAGSTDGYPPGALINLLGYKIYLFKCSWDIEGALYLNVGEYLEYEAENFNREYFLSNFDYEVYGNGVLKNWVYNNPVLMSGRTGFIYKDNRLHPVSNDNMYTNVSSLVYPISENITEYINEGYNVIGLEYAVSDLTYANWVGIELGDPDIGGTHVVNCEKPFITPRIPVPNTGQAVSTLAMDRCNNALNIYPEILSDSSSYLYYGSTFNEVYYCLLGYRTCTRYLYGLFYYFPICDFYFQTINQNNLLYTMNRMGAELHFYGQASPKYAIFDI